METKTKVRAVDGSQEILITREFDLPLDLLFKAYSEAALLEQWMGTKVLHLDSKKFGSYEIETRDPKGNIAFHAGGVIHAFKTDEKIVRTFEMFGTSFGVQLETYLFKSNGDKSILEMHVVYESVEKRDGVLKLPFAQGINYAHNRLEEIVKKQNNLS